VQTRTLCPALIGRDGELAVLSDALRAARDGTGQAVLVAGDAGIGKTRLVDELATPAEAAGVPVLRGGCAETDLRIPYLPFIEALRGHARRDAVTRQGGLDALFEAQEGEGSDLAG
jgi:predicted ATPase